MHFSIVSFSRLRLHAAVIFVDREYIITLAAFFTHYLTMLSVKIDLIVVVFHHLTMLELPLPWALG